MGLTSPEDIVKDQAKKRNNAHFMLVDGMSKLMTQKIKRCESLDFHAYGLKWKLVILSDQTKDYLSFYLLITDEQCTGSNWGLNCSFKLSIVSQIGTPNFSIPFELDLDSEHSSWGQPSFISQHALKEMYVVNDKAVFCAEITGVKTPKVLKVASISRTMGTAERLTLTEVPRSNSRFTWKITQFSSFDGEHHSSYEFTVGPRRWYLEMYPKGYLDGKDNSLSLFLHASDFVSKGPVQATSAVYKLRVLDQFKRNHHESGILDSKSRLILTRPSIRARTVIGGKVAKATRTQDGHSSWNSITTRPKALCSSTIPLAQQLRKQRRSWLS